MRSVPVSTGEPQWPAIRSGGQASGEIANQLRLRGLFERGMKDLRRDVWHQGRKFPVGIARVGGASRERQECHGDVVANQCLYQTGELAAQNRFLLGSGFSRPQTTGNGTTVALAGGDFLHMDTAGCGVIEASDRDYDVIDDNPRLERSVNLITKKRAFQDARRSRAEDGEFQTGPSHWIVLGSIRAGVKTKGRKKLYQEGRTGTTGAAYADTPGFGAI